MEIFDSIAKAAKDFFVEPDGSVAPIAGPAVPVPGALPPPPLTPPQAGSSQPEQRHLTHIAGLLTGDGKDFAAYLKMVKSMAAAGMSGQLLYQTAFNAFAAINGTTVAGLLASATTFEAALQTDRSNMLARHREKTGEIRAGAAAPSLLGQLTGQQQQLSQEIADLTRQLQARQLQLTQTQQQLSQEQQKVQSALASYEAAHARALTELQTHRKAAEAFLTGAAGQP